MDLRFLPKLLLQHDESPYVDNYETHLLIKAGDNKISFSLHPSGEVLAIALEQRLVLIRLQPATTTPRQDHLNQRRSGSGTDVQFITATEAPERITSLAWLTSSTSSSDSCLLLGTSNGRLQLHAAADGAMFHRQDIHLNPLLCITVRWSGSALLPGDATEDITLTFTDAVSRVPTWEVWSLLRWHSGAKQRSDWSWTRGTGPPTHKLNITKWTFGRNIGPRSFAACLGNQPPALYDLLRKSAVKDGVRLLTTGAKPPVATFFLQESATHGITSMVSSLAVSGATALLGKARGLVPGAGKPKSNSGGCQDGPKQEKVPSLPATAIDSVNDGKRTVIRTALSPCCRWAACCDSLGRVLVVDAADGVLIRLFKGYRDAQTAWLVTSSSISSSSAIEVEAIMEIGGTTSQPPKDNNDQLQPNEQSFDEAVLLEKEENKQQPSSYQKGGKYLVIYAPLRRVVEVWDPFQGHRIGALPAMPRHGLLLQQPAVPVRGGGYRVDTGRKKEYAANTCWMLDIEALELVDLGEALEQVLRNAAGGPVDATAPRAAGTAASPY